MTPSGKTPASQKPWEIYALRYARHERLGRENLLRPADIHDLPMPLDYFIWLLKSDERVILVDTGFSEAGALKRGRVLIRSVSEALAGIGIAPEQVEDVIITHLHYDHAGNLDLFTKARFHLQDREMGFATGRHMCQACLRYPFEVEDVVTMVRAVYAERVEFHNGDAEIDAGISLHHVGGHSDGMQIVRVMTERGAVVLASDASHFYQNMATQNPFPIYYDLGAMAQGWKKARLLAKSADHVIPGHDPKVREIYPEFPGSDGETVLLHMDPISLSKL